MKRAAFLCLALLGAPVTVNAGGLPIQPLVVADTFQMFCISWSKPTDAQRWVHEMAKRMPYFEKGETENTYVSGAGHVAVSVLETDGKSTCVFDVDKEYAYAMERDFLLEKLTATLGENNDAGEPELLDNGRTWEWQEGATSKILEYIETDAGVTLRLTNQL